MLCRSFFPNFGLGLFPKIAGKGPDKIDGIFALYHLLSVCPYAYYHLTLCILTDSSFWFHTINFEFIHCTYLGVSAYNLKKMHFFEDHFILPLQTV